MMNKRLGAMTIGGGLSLADAMFLPLMGSSRYLAAELSLRGLRIESDAFRMKLLREYLNGERPKKILRLDCDFLCGRAFFICSKNETLETKKIDRPKKG
jgi:hypothetical protein